MICSKRNDKELTRFNYAFINEDNVRVWNATDDMVMSYDEWLEDYYIVEKMNSIKI